jgi:hypothetical protein
LSDDEAETAIYLTEPEVAKILRRHPSAIKRLRLAGKLAYLPGRPVLIARTALEDYIGSIAIRTAEPPSVPPPSPEKGEKTEAEKIADARAWALKKKAKPKRVRGPARRSTGA